MSDIITRDEAERDRQARIEAAERRDRPRNDAERAIVGLIASLALKYGALDELSHMELNIPALMALAAEHGVTAEDLQGTMTQVQIYVLQLQAVTGGTWAECWDGLKERWMRWMQEINTEEQI